MAPPNPSRTYAPGGTRQGVRWKKLAVYPEECQLPVGIIILQAQAGLAPSGASATPQRDVTLARLGVATRALVSLNWGPPAQSHPSTIGAFMMKTAMIPIADIYVPVKRRATLNPELVRRLAESILENGQQAPILVRQDGQRYVLVEGLHRLEACKELGETTIPSYLVQARRH